MTSARSTRPRRTYDSLRWAAQLGDLADVEALLAKGADPNEIDQTSTPLCMAVFHAKQASVRALLAAGASPAVMHPRDSAPLVYACKMKTRSDAKRLAIVRMLLAAGADPDPRIGSNRLIDWCAGQKHLAKVRAVLVDARTATARAPRTR